jgi:hypothetical protein
MVRAVRRSSRPLGSPRDQGVAPPRVCTLRRRTRAGKHIFLKHFRGVFLFIFFCVADWNKGECLDCLGSVLCFR